MTTDPQVNTTTRYTHLELGKDVVIAIAGYYTPTKELRLKYNDREVLCVIGNAVVESSCCGVGRWLYAIVPGYIVNWQNSTSETGLPVSDVESIKDEKTREDIRHIIQTQEGVALAAFW